MLFFCQAGPMSKSNGKIHLKENVLLLKAQNWGKSKTENEQKPGLVQQIVNFHLSIYKGSTKWCEIINGDKWDCDPGCPGV